MTEPEQRLLAVLPAYGIMTAQRAGYHAGLTDGLMRQAANGLLKAELIEATQDGRLVPIASRSSVLSLTEAGRQVQARGALAGQS